LDAHAMEHHLQHDYVAEKKLVTDEIGAING
jgi:hypothetical protein